MIQIHNLNKNYSSNKVLRDVNITFQRGEINGIVGENGAGKTTLFKCIAGLENYSGAIKYDSGILKNVIGYLPTNPFFFTKITGNEYLQLLCNARKVELKNIKDKNIFDLPLNKYVETYSTGMKKKLALNGVLLQKNDVYIFDEPFNGVDIQGNILIKEILIKLKELDKIIILSSHIFATLSDNCDFIHHLDNQKITLRVGKKNFELIENKLFKPKFKDKLNMLNLN